MTRVEPDNFFVLGLTGSIGMGKTTVANVFRKLGVPVQDADQVVHQLYSKGGAAVEPIGALFPDALVGGAVERGLLSKHVVGNEAAMKKLEALVHPLVTVEREKFLAEVASRGSRLAVLDIPLLYETGGETTVDAVLVVSAPPEVQRQRVLARPGMTEAKFEAIIARQLPDAEKRQRADFVIVTDVSLEETEAHVSALVTALQGRAGSVRCLPRSS